MSGGRLINTFPYGFTRPIVYGEYPYYRAAPDRWGPNLAALAQAGVDVVTCYVPWRFHEIAPRRYDFTGARDGQRDLPRLLDLAAAEGLRVMLKPGPFIHAEVQLGGLPDRVSPGVDGRYAAVLDAWGKPVMSQGLPLPSLFDARYRAEVGHWLAAVQELVLRRALAPHGPVVAVQLGNEGIYSDGNRPAAAHDFAAPAVEAFEARLAAAGSPLAGTMPAGPAADWPAGLKAAWAEHSGAVLRDQYLALAAGLVPEVRRVATVNLPLPALAGPPESGASWLLRTGRLAETGLAEGYTAWVGNAARSRTAFGAHWFGVRARRSDNVEENWGFTWTDPAFGQPANALFHALLALALGSRSCSVYTACATEHWGPLVDLDPEGVRADGADPQDFAPPYCPGAPLREDGGAGANLAALHALRDLVRTAPGRLGGHFLADAALVVPESVALAEAWPDGERPAEAAVPAAVRTALELMERHQFQIEVLTEAATAEAVPDGSLRSRRTQMPWLVVFGPDGPGALLADRLGAHRRSGGAVVPLLAGGAMPADALARLLPAPRYAHPATDPAVVLVHADAAGEPAAVFAFNLAAEHHTVRRTVRGRQVCVELPPRGAACLWWTGDAFAVAAGTAGLEPLPPPPVSAFPSRPHATKETA
ncbi:beta-galactosidase [Phytohabitans rumicis]|uniref:beta-galactosidase n=1 Tax=Phytohabitans rumicis TaxID=1076125 RepID=UPI0031EB944B